MDWIYTLKHNTQEKNSTLTLHIPRQIHNYLDDLKAKLNTWKIYPHLCDRTWWHDTSEGKIVNYVMIDREQTKNLLEELNYLIEEIDHIASVTNFSTFKVPVEEVEMSHYTHDSNRSYFEDWIQEVDEERYCSLTKERLLDFFEALKFLVEEAINTNQELWFDED